MSLDQKFLTAKLAAPDLKVDSLLAILKELLESGMNELN